MSVVFIDGPDYSGKTTKAKMSENYREWSSTSLGQELRAYFISAEKSTETTVERSLAMWRNWMKIGTTEDVVVDRSPVSTMAEQVMGDLDSLLFHEYMAELMTMVHEFGILTINVIMIEDEVLIERESKGERVKDKREELRTPSERNALYKRAITRMAQSAPHWDVEVTELEIENEMTSYIFTPRQLPLTSFFGELRFDCTTVDESIRKTIGNPTHPLVVMPKCLSGSIVEALDLTKYLTIKDLARNGVTETCSSSVMTVSTLDELVLSPKRRLFPTDIDTTLVDGYLKRIAEYETYNMGFTLADYLSLANEGATTISRFKFNYFSVQILAAYFIYKINKDTPPWNIT